MLSSGEIRNLEASWVSALPSQTVEYLKRKGLTAETLGQVIDRGPEEPVLLTGSYASGEHNSTSDIDILIITQESVCYLSEKTLNHPSIFGDSYDVKVGEISVNIEFVTVEKVRELAQIAHRASNSNPPTVANFQGLELRLAHRFITGIPLLGVEHITGIRAGVHLDQFQCAAIALNFIMAMSFLEDSMVLGSPDNLLMIRASGESLALAALNAFGPITYGIKHIRSRSIKLVETGIKVKVLQDIDCVIQIDRLPLEEGQKTIEMFAEDLLWNLGITGHSHTVRKMLRPYASNWPKLTALL